SRPRHLLIPIWLLLYNKVNDRIAQGEVVVRGNAAKDAAFAVRSKGQRCVHGVCCHHAGMVAMITTRRGLTPSTGEKTVDTVPILGYASKQYHSGKSMAMKEIGRASCRERWRC